MGVFTYAKHCTSRTIKKKVLYSMNVYCVVWM